MQSARDIQTLARRGTAILVSATSDQGRTEPVIDLHAAQRIPSKAHLHGFASRLLSSRTQLSGLSLCCDLRETEKLRSQLGLGSPGESDVVAR